MDTEDLMNAMAERDEWRERESRKSTLAARHDDDGDDIYIYIYI